MYKSTNVQYLEGLFFFSISENPLNISLTLLAKTLFDISRQKGLAVLVECMLYFQDYFEPVECISTVAFGYPQLFYDAREGIWKFWSMQNPQAYPEAQYSISKALQGLDTFREGRKDFQLSQVILLWWHAGKL